MVISIGKLMVTVNSAFASRKQRKDEEIVKFNDDVSEVISHAG